MKTIADRMGAALRNKDWTPSELHRATKISLSSITAYLRDSRKPPLDKCRIIGSALGVSGDWIFYGHSKSEAPQLTHVNATNPIPIRSENDRGLLPVYGDAVEGDHGRIDLSGGIVGRVSAPPGFGDVPDAYAVFVVGDTMEPRYYAGEIVYLHPRKPVRRGDFVFIQITRDDGGIDGYIKRLVQITGDIVVCEQLAPELRMEFPRARVRSVHKIVLSGEG